MLKRMMFVFVMAAGLWFINRMPVVEAGHPHQDMHDTGDETALPLETRQLIDDVRGATADFRDVKTAEDAGYGIFQNCFTEEGVGGMGQHYVNGDLAGDDVVDPLKPEALVYEPREDGKLLLVALEYLVFADNWKSEDPPTAFGQDFHLLTDIPETPPVWALHIWLWSHNTDGLFADYNPIIFCPEDAPTTS
jgi:hypothetical protein